MSKTIDLLQNTFASESFRKAIFSRPRKKTDETPRKISVRPILVNQKSLAQWTSHFPRNESHENFSLEDSVTKAERLLTDGVFGECQIFTTQTDHTIRISRKGDVKISSRPAESTTPVVLEHNLQKQYLIPEGVPCGFLEAIGVMNSEGTVRKPKYGKFRQINRFLEFVNDVCDHLPKNQTIHVVDYGCGKSYLTFALHYFLKEQKKLDVKITGLDLRDDVIATANSVCEKLNIPKSELNFHVGEIASLQPGTQIDLAVCLHACDTATDDALMRAIEAEASVILAVPCCQHELHHKIDPSRLSALMKHGILHERFSALSTDALRACLLERCGYKTQVVEFIDMEHTAKNILIRATKSNRDAKLKLSTEDDYNELMSFLGLTDFHLESILKKRNLL